MENINKISKYIDKLTKGIFASGILAVLILNSTNCANKTPETASNQNLQNNEEQKPQIQEVKLVGSNSIDGIIIEGVESLSLTFNMDISATGVNSLKIEKNNANFTSFSTEIDSDKKTLKIIFAQNEPQVASVYKIKITQDLFKTNKPLATQLQTLEYKILPKTDFLFVTPEGLASNSGESWQQALDLQGAIDKASKTQKKYLLVKQGSYFADPQKNDASKSFELKNKVKIYGGFSENLTEKRLFNKSILEGELQPELNTNLLIKGDNLSDETILDGFLIQNAANKNTNKKGAGIYLSNNSKPKLQNLTLQANKLSGNNSNGGAIYLDNSSPSITNVKFIKNLADNGGAISIDTASPILKNVEFIENTAQVHGGAIYNEKDLTINQAIFTKNKAAKHGGAIANFAGVANIEKTTFDENSANLEGGAIYLSLSSKVTIKNSEFNKNIAIDKTQSLGGAIYSTNSELKITDAVFNKNQSYRGAGLYNIESKTQLVKTSFDANEATYAGAICTEELSELRIKNSSFSNNKANNGSGGAIETKGSSKNIIMNTSFKNNYASYQGGAIYASSHSPLYFSNLVFADNITDKLGGALAVSYSEAKLYNSIFWNNKVINNGQETINNIRIVGADESSCKFSFKNSIANKDSVFNNKSFKSEDIYNFMQDKSNSYADPQLNADLIAQKTNLVKNKGNDSLYIDVLKQFTGKNIIFNIGADETDLAGNKRLQGTKIDIGTHELQ